MALGPRHPRGPIPIPQGRLDEAHLISKPVAALAAAGPATGDHLCVLPVARSPSRPAKLSAPGRIRHQHHLRGPDEFQGAVEQPGIPQLVAGDGGLCRAGHGAVDGFRTAAGSGRGPDDPVDQHLYYAAGLALCGGPGGGGHPVVVHLQPDHRRHALCAGGRGLRLEPHQFENRRHDPGGDRKRLEADQL